MTRTSPEAMAQVLVSPGGGLRLMNRPSGSENRTDGRVETGTSTVGKLAPEEDPPQAYLPIA